MIKLELKAKKNGKEFVIEQSVRVVAVPAFTARGFTVVEEKHTAKEIKNQLKAWDVKHDPKATLEQLVKLL